TFGYGMLRDAGGDDTYRTGGAYLHAPLLPEDYQSFSHGFGMGWRPRAGGGIGVLYDLNGNDFYDGEVFCEGSSYWYSLGILVDGGGNDSYNATQYAQGAGIHLSIGAFWDKGGDDQYHSRNGVVGGTAHDLSVGMLIDDKGDDSYIVSGGYGVSLTNSFALFIDKLGNDMYSTREDHSYGSVRWGRGFAGCGIFLDLEGKDIYPRNTLAADGNTWMQFGWGIGIDLDRDIITSRKEEEIGEIILTAEDSLKSVEELYEEASLWQVGSNRKKVARAKKAFLAKGMQAVDYICQHKLGTTSSLELRLIDELAKTYPDSISPILLTKIYHENRFIQKNSIRLLGTTKYKKAVEPLLEMLKKKKNHKLRISIISALGNIGDKKATIPISKFIDDKQELCRINVVSSIKKIKDERAIPTLIHALNDPMFTVRSAAMTALTGYSNIETAQILIEYINNKNSIYPELGVNTLAGIIETFSDSTTSDYNKLKYETMNLFEELVKNQNEQIRAEAVEAIYRTGRELQRKWIDMNMESEYSPIVKAAYARITKEMENKE
ncbi:MAG: HEAT repeat domain-containing protein, partial [Candidatus Cloacimonetes bacterium]|nr:HEAT repeat domain-containing protein [Candidatus Cloacimonadota bacterium]